MTWLEWLRLAVELIGLLISFFGGRKVAFRAATRNLQVYNHNHDDGSNVLPTKVANLSRRQVKNVLTKGRTYP